jgi:hypothetical protein
MVWEEKVFDLSDLKDSTMIGTIGELIAWRYLREVTGTFPMWFGAGSYFHPQYPRRICENYEIKGFNEAQIEFLRKLSRMYDFIVVKRKRIAPGLVGEPEDMYLVEVKTTFRERRHDLKGGIKGIKRKLPKVEEVEMEKKLGFRVLVIVVRLLDGWKFRVTCKEL